MQLFDRFKKFIACAILVCFIPSQAWAQGINIPAGASLNLNSGQLIVPGDVNNAGTLTTVTGPITLTGSWTNSGTFNSGAGTVNFSAPGGTQTINSGGAAASDAFYNLTHSTASTIQLNSNAIAINEDFTNTAGTFNANNLNMNVGGNWENTAAFTSGTDTVTLNGPNGSVQDVLGSTTFYGFSKVNTAAATLTFDAAGTQNFTNSLTMQGNSATNLLNILSTVPGTQARINLNAGAPQSINFVNVQDSNAGIPPGNQTLVARVFSAGSPTQHNTNWFFGNTTYTWTGTVSTDWNNPANWTPSLVPGPGDSVIVPVVANEPVFSTNVNVGNLTIDTGASVNINGFNITVTSSFVNDGTFELHGNEATVALTQDITDPGTFEYLGDGTSNPITIINFPGASNYYNLLINDTNATKNTFVTNSAITTVGNVTVTSGNLNISTNSDTLTVNGTLAVNGANGALTATNGNIAANGSVNLSAGTFTAPSVGKTFTVTGNFTNSSGNYVPVTHLTGFNANSGTVNMNGTNQSVLGTTVFYSFTKIVTTSEALTFDATVGALQTFTNTLTLGGNSPANLLTINSTNPGTQADIVLLEAGIQNINYVNVQDSNAGTSPTDQTLVARMFSAGSPTQHNTNWFFGVATETWNGSTSTDWNTPSNWSPAVVPGSGDTVIIPNGVGITYQPVLFSNVAIAGLTINTGSTLTLSGYNLTVSPLGAGTFNNLGTLILEGDETLTLTMDSTHGTFEYVGQDGGASVNHTLTINGSTNLVFNNLTINDTNSTPANRDVFTTNGMVTVNGNVTVSSGTLDASNSNTTTLAVDGNVSITTPGIFKAPSAGKTFTVSGNFGDTGTFVNSSGLVTLNGTNQTISGTSTFYQLSKVVAAAATLTFDHTGLQTITNSLTLQGAPSQLLSIRSDLTGTQADIALTAGGLQNISEVNVQYSNAGTLPTDLTLIARNNSVDAPPGGTNTNWNFGNPTITWTGTVSTDWNNPLNWNLGIVPIAGDNVVIPNATNQPVLTTAVTIGSLTINSGSTLTLNGKNLTVNTSSGGAGILTNNGTIILNGSETVAITTVNTNAGTFEYVGDNTGGTYNITNLLTTTNPSNNVYYNLVIDDTHATPDTFTTGIDPLTVDGNLTLTSGSLNLSGSTAVNVTGNVTISSGTTLTAPSATTNTAFDVGGNWTNSGTFVNSSGAVTLTTTATAVITGNTTFYDLFSTAGGKTVKFTAGSDQTVTNSFIFNGLPASLINVLSTVTGTPWNITVSGGAQNVTHLNVEDSNALTNTITCTNCTNSLDNNANWIFSGFRIISPAISTTVGQVPTIIGQAPPNSTVYIRDISGNLVATAKSDANGYFRVEVGQDAANTHLAITAQLATGANSLTPYLTTALTSPGDTDNFNVVASPTSSQVPTITQINSNVITNPSLVQTIVGQKPTLVGQGAPNQPVTVQALDANGNLLLSVGTATVNAIGAYTVTLTTPLPTATNFLSVTVGTPTTETTSVIIEVALTDPFGIVYNATTNLPIQGATVTLYSEITKQPAVGVQSCNMAGVCSTANPFTVLADGFYSFLAPPGQYYINASAGGYTFPSVATNIPSGRSVTTGSKGQVFTVGGTVFELDLPMDGNSSLLHITKNANKSEGSVGDIVMYTVTIQNLSSTNTVTNVYLNDEIPPGFKYIKDRVLLNGTSTSEPSGQRPLLFNIGTVAPGATVTLQYQLVIGSGVTMGNYQNTATARYINGTVISNPAQATVKIVLDPVFDLGTVIGKVFFDWDESGIQKPPYFNPISHQTIVDKPVPNVQIMMEDGTVITTDHNGQFNIPGLLPGRHIFRVDERTLPPGAYLTTDKAVIVDVTAGSISKVNFGVNIDESQTKGRDAVFFNEKISLTEDHNRPVPRLNAALFDASANAKPNTEEVLLNEGALVRQAEFRIFTNYSSFISSWHLDIMDTDTRKVIKTIQGTPLNINDPIYWNGQDDQGIIINPDHKYSYTLSVIGNKNNSDDTKEKFITIREIKDEVTLKKERDESKDVLKDRATRYRKWLDDQTAVNNLNHQVIQIQGETIHLDRQGTDVKSIRVMKGNNLFMDIPLTEQYGLTPQELMAGGFSTTDEKDNMEVILPNGDYVLDVVSVKAPDAASPASDAAQVLPSSGVPSPAVSASPGPLEHYSRPLKIGDDYIMFVALGDAQVGYNIDRGNIEPIQDKTEEPGFYDQGKGAYYLKGQILGKYLITSSFDSDRAQKALFRQLDPNTYYPVYGDNSSINYDAADTQGALYLKVEWDKSSAILGNYVIDFNDTEFAAFSQKYYGGMIDYKSVSSNPYGDARTRIVIFHAQIQQLPSHNEFLATGGSLYFLKYKNVVQGSDTVTIQVRDQTTGLVVASQTMTNGADYELDNSNGSILFWQPVAMIAQSENIISNNLVNGDPIYVVVDYQYAVSGLQTQGAQGARVAQAIGDNVVLGGTYVQDNSNGQNYTLAGTDATLHVNKDSTVKAEYAQTSSQETGSYVSTDGGITFTPLMLNSSVSGEAYGIKGDTRLFDNIGLKTYYKWIGNNFGATDTTSQQGTEKMGMSMTFDMTPVTRLTASEDIQRLLAQNNIQTSTQIGASETDTTMVQIVHTQEKLKLTGEFQMIETKSVINGVESTTNQRGATMGGQAQYDLTNRIKLTLGQQVDVENPANTATTIGVAARMTDQMTMNAQEVFSSEGKALTAGVTNQIGKKIALTTDYTLTNLNTGEIDKTASIGLSDQISKNITTTGTVAATASSTGGITTTASIGTIAKLSDTATLSMNVGKAQGMMGAQGATNVNLNGTTQIGDTTLTGTAQANGGLTAGGTSIINPVVTPTSTDITSNPLSIGTTGVTAMSSFGVQATTKVNDMTTTNGSVNVANDTSGGKTTTFGFGNTSKLDQELQAVTDTSFSLSPGTGTSDSNKYGIVNTNQSGQKVETDFTQQSASQPGTVTQSNIFGLSGDVNDKLALNGSIEHGKVQNLGTSQSTITDFSLGSGYVLKDTESAQAKFKNSIKLELRVDKGIGTDSLRQYVLYDAMEGRINDNTTANIKVDYSKTLDTTTNAVAERHEEVILGMAYRPVNFDNLNLIAEYSYQDGYGGGLQQADALNTNVQTTIAQVFSGEAVYDINDQWQAAEKIAYRLENEQDTGFAFTQTHTWLVIQRLSYKIDRDWTLSGEYRDLAQVEAKDNKQGILLEATRSMNANTELTIGWNFTNYTDDLTNLSYSSMGPFVRMTGKFYDETPEERARARAKWLDARISEWAWILIRKELAKKDSKIVLELNRMFALAKASRAAGRLEESRQIYKDIISAGQMMYDEASEYIRGRVDFEEQLQKLDKTAREYFKGGEYVKARKIWEKVVDDASKGVVK